MDQQQYKQFIYSNREQAGRILQECEKLKEKVTDADILSVIDHAKMAAKAAGNLCDISERLPAGGTKAEKARSQIFRYNSDASGAIGRAIKMIDERR